MPCRVPTVSIRRLDSRQTARRIEADFITAGEGTRAAAGAARSPQQCPARRSSPGRQARARGRARAPATPRPWSSPAAPVFWPRFCPSGTTTAPVLDARHLLIRDHLVAARRRPHRSSPARRPARAKLARERSPGERRRRSPSAATHPARAGPRRAPRRPVHRPPRSHARERRRRGRFPVPRAPRPSALRRGDPLAARDQREAGADRLARLVDAQRLRVVAHRDSPRALTDFVHAEKE